MRVGLALPHYDFSLPGQAASVDAAVAWAVRAEEMGFDSVRVSDHFFLDLAKYGGPADRYGSLDPLVLLTAVAAQTRRVRLGTLVLASGFRHPAALAKAAATLDVASGGRLELGLGAGWYEAEFRAMGLPFPPLRERIDALDEYVAVVAGMLTEEAFSFDGRYHTVDHATNLPRPVQRPRPAVWVGAKGGPRMLRLVAERADGWNVAWRLTPEAYAERVAALERACAAAGRDPATVRRSVGLGCLLGEDERDLEAQWRALQRWAPGGALDGVDLVEYRRDLLVGTPEEVAERLRAFEALGAEEVVLTFASLPFAIADPNQVALAAEHLLPKVR